MQTPDAAFDRAAFDRGFAEYERTLERERLEEIDAREARDAASIPDEEFIPTPEEAAKIKARHAAVADAARRSEFEYRISHDTNLLNGDALARVEYPTRRTSEVESLRGRVGRRDDLPDGRIEHRHAYPALRGSPWIAPAAIEREREGRIPWGALDRGSACARPDTKDGKVRELVDEALRYLERAGARFPK